MAKYKIISVKNRSLIFTVRGNEVYREDSKSVVYTVLGNKIYHGSKTLFEPPVYEIKDNVIYSADYKHKPEFVIDGDFITDAKGKKIYKVVRDYSFSFDFFSSDKDREDNKQNASRNSPQKPANNRNVRSGKTGKPSSFGSILAVLCVGLFILYVAGLFGKDDSTEAKKAVHEEKDSQEEVEEDQARSVLSITDEQKSEFVFWDSDTRYLTDEEASGLEPLVLQAAINEIYARHGRIWKDDNWNNYFSSKSWYVPKYSADEFSTDVFNEVEKANIDMLAKYRK